MEAVMLANISEDPDLRVFYEDKTADMHSYVASKVYKELSGFSMSYIKENHPEERSNAKKAGFAIVFGGTGFTVSVNLGISKELGNAFETGFFEAFPKLKEFFEHRFNETMKNGYITIDPNTNSKLFVHNIDYIRKLQAHYSFDNKEFWDEYKIEKNIKSEKYLQMKEGMSNYFKLVGKIKRESQNYIIQGSSASVMKIAMTLLYNYIVKNNLLDKVLIANQVHDRNLLWLN